MSTRRRSPGPGGTEREPQRKPAVRPGRYRRLFTGGAALALVAMTVAYWATHRGPATPSPFPPPAAGAPSAQVAFEDFVGAESCRQCHTEQYAAWRSSTHGRAGGPPTQERVIAPFNQVPLHFKDAVVTPSVTNRGEYSFRVAQNRHAVQEFRVAEVVGGGFMTGGG